MDSAANVTIGQRLRQIRQARGKSLRVIAGLAGISKSKLSCIERGERALDSRSETVALANALQISPSELIGEPVAAPSDGRPSDQSSAASELSYGPPVVLATFAKADLVEDLPEDLTPHIHAVQNS